MSNTVSGVDARAYLAGWAQAVSGMTAADIKAIPEDKWPLASGGSTRTNPSLIADIVCNLRWTTGVLKGEESDAYNAMPELSETYAAKEAAIGGLMEAVGEFCTALTEASDEHLNSTQMAPWGMPAPVMTFAHIAVSHIWYHDGQLNYVQCLLGDEKVHWMGD